MMDYFFKILVLCLCLHLNGERSRNVRKVQGMLGKWDINATNEDLVTAVHVAAVKCNADMANVLIKSGANVNLQRFDGQTPLHVSATNGNLQFANTLIKHGAAIDAIDQNGVTPLQLAVFEDDVRMANLLIKSGANVNHIDADGKSVMHWAASKGSDEMAEILIKNGVKNVSVQDHVGKTPLYYAVLTGNSKFQEALRHFLIFGSAATPQLHIELLLLLVFGLWCMTSF